MVVECRYEGEEISDLLEVALEGYDPIVFELADHMRLCSERMTDSKSGGWNSQGEPVYDLEANDCGRDRSRHRAADNRVGDHMDAKRPGRRREYRRWSYRDGGDCDWRYRVTCISRRSAFRTYAPAVNACQESPAASRARADRLHVVGRLRDLRILGSPVRGLDVDR